jgi:hypothetical protein
MSKSGLFCSEIFEAIFAGKKSYMASLRHFCAQIFKAVFLPRCSGIARFLLAQSTKTGKNTK